MELLVEHGTLLMGIAIASGFFMCWGIGANDVANAMGTSVGSKAITVGKAILIAAIFEFAGVILAGGHVTKTIRKGIIDPEPIIANPEILVFGMLASLLAAAVWLAIASWRGWPVSTTHSIVGAIIGFAIAGIGMDSVNWGKTGQIAASWVISPLLGGFIAFVLMTFVIKTILDRERPFESAKKYAPLLLFLLGFLISLVTFFKGLKHLDIDLSIAQTLGLSVGIGILTAIIGRVVINRVRVDKDADRDFHYASVEKVFAPMQVFTACAMAFAHGSNDVANGIGPLAAVVSIVQSGTVTQSSQMPAWLLVLGGVGIVTGLATLGYRVMRTIGKEITHLTPSRGFCAELAAAGTVVVASRTGIPVSTTHILVGAVMGVGLARGIAALDMRVIGKIVTSWVITIPVGAILSMMFFAMFRAIFGF